MANGVYTAIATIVYGTLRSIKLLSCKGFYPKEVLRQLGRFIKLGERSELVIKKLSFWSGHLAYIALADKRLSYGLDLSCPKRKRLEVSKYVKYIAITTKASKSQVFKVRPGQDLNPGHPR